MHNNHYTNTALAVIIALLATACAKMGQPDGGWYDEQPPRIVSSTPNDGAVNVSSKKITILFDEFIALDNPTEKVVVSPPQMEQAEVKGAGKRIIVELKDSLKPNTTYTVDFSDAISDNNENNPMGNYTYSFSTGSHIDTMQVAGHVLDASSLEPVKGILVGLYSNLSDTAFTREPMLRVSRTDSRGRFVIKGVAPGSYRIYALQDMDGNFMFSQKSETMAFLNDVIVPSSMPDVKQDTLWQDSLHIKNIVQTGYTRYLPDNLVLKAFTETLTDRYLLKSERQQAGRFTLFFSYGEDEMPQVKGLNFDADGAFLVEATPKRDTITYWLRDSSLINTDTLNIELTYRATDTLGVLRQQCDTLTLLSKEPLAKRQKKAEREREEWQKKQDKARKRGDHYETVMPQVALTPDYRIDSEPDPDRNITITMPQPLTRVDTAALHLYSKIDTLWYRSPLMLREVPAMPRTYELLGEWRPGVEYSLEIDSAAFTDIYGHTSEAFKRGFKVRDTDYYGTLLVTLPGMQDTTCVVQLLDAQDKPFKTVTTRTGNAEFFYLKPGTCYMRMYIDANNNGQWDTGCYATGLQPETTFYYPQQVDIKAKWDITLTWQPAKTHASRQKPLTITKQKPDKDKAIKQRNAERARKLGVEYVK